MSVLVYPTFRIRSFAWVPDGETAVVGFILLLLQLADGVLTSLGIQRFGLEMEGNPLLRLLMEEFGQREALVALKTTSALLVVFLVMISGIVHWVRKALGAISLFYLLLSVLPWTYLLFIRPPS